MNTDEIETVESAPVSQPLSLYDNTRLSDWRRCGRYYYYRHIRDWVPDRKSMPLIFGSSYHSAMDTIWNGYEIIRDGDKKAVNALVDSAYAAFIETWTESGMPPPQEMSADELEDLGARTPQTAEEMLYHYVDARKTLFSDKTFKLLDVERPFAVPLDPNDPTLFYIGRIDKEFSWRGNVYIGEHKTSSSYRKGDVPFRNGFIDSFSPNSQVDGYLFQGQMLYGEKLAGVWIDASLVHKSVHNGFMFIPIDKQFAQLEGWLWTTHHYIAQIEGNMQVIGERAALDTNYLAAFPMNTSSCSNYGGCPYADICRAVANPAKLEDAPAGYKKEHWEPFDTLRLEKLGFTLQNQRVYKVEPPQ